MSELVISRRELLRQFNLRGDPTDASYVEAMTNAIRTTLPVSANTLASSAVEAYWLGPDEWHIIVPEAQVESIREAMQATADARHVAINDVSGGYVVLQLAGANSVELLAKGCTLDLHPDVFGAGQCAQTGLGKAPVLLARRADGPVFDIVVRSSFADYLSQWMERAGRELGIEFR